MYFVCIRKCNSQDLREASEKGWKDNVIKISKDNIIVLRITWFIGSSLYTPGLEFEDLWYVELPNLACLNNLFATVTFWNNIKQPITYMVKHWFGHIINSSISNSIEHALILIVNVWIFYNALKVNLSSSFRNSNNDRSIAKHVHLNLNLNRPPKYFTTISATFNHSN